MPLVWVPSLHLRYPIALSCQLVVLRGIMLTGSGNLCQLWAVHAVDLVSKIRWALALLRGLCLPYERFRAVSCCQLSGTLSGVGVCFSIGVYYV